MAPTRSSSACPAVVLLLVLVVVAHAMAAAPGIDTAEAPTYRHELLSWRHDALAPAAGAGAVRARGALAGCVRTALQRTSRPCVRDALLTLVFGRLHLSRGCCDALAGVGEQCVADVFSCVPQLGPALLPVVNRICGLVATIA